MAIPNPGYVRPNVDYSDAGLRRKFLAQSTRDDLEEAFIDESVKETASKLLKQIANEPKEYQRRVALALARKCVDLDRSTETDEYGI